MFSFHFLECVFLGVFALACYFVGLRGWRFVIIWLIVALATLFLALTYEHMIRGLLSR